MCFIDLLNYEMCFIDFAHVTTIFLVSKGVNVNFLLCSKCYENFKNYHAIKLNKTYLMNICFA